MIWLEEGYIVNSNVLVSQPTVYAVCFLIVIQVGGEEFTTTIIHEYKGPKQPEDEEWSDKRSLEHFGLCLNNFEPT